MRGDVALTVAVQVTGSAKGRRGAAHGHGQLGLLIAPPGSPVLMHVGGGGCDGIYRRLRNADGLRESEGGRHRAGREGARGGT